MLVPYNVILSLRSWFYCISYNAKDKFLSFTKWCSFASTDIVVDVLTNISSINASIKIFHFHASKATYSSFKAGIVSYLSEVASEQQPKMIKNYLILTLNKIC